VKLYCAVDFMGETAVRLTQGDFARRTEHGDAVELALRFVDAGARHLHVVDLDAARGATLVNRSVVLRIVEEAGVPVQVGGGARSSAEVTTLLRAGVARVVMTTAAVEDPELVEDLAEQFPGRLAVGIDHRKGAGEGAQNGPGRSLDDRVAVRGWEQSGSLTVGDLVERFSPAPLGAFVVTSIERDGMMIGPDSSGLRSIMEQTDHAVIASGGVRSTEDLAMLARLSVKGPNGEARGLEGAIVGRALASGALGIREAVAACEP
jgi:phosphoribosylformimino-5-aminoimidazole carboxamide ribotide isomerase